MAAAVEYPILDGITLNIELPLTKELWAKGERTSDVTVAAYALGWAEPYITWAGELAWRATDAGKKAGLK